MAGMYAVYHGPKGLRYIANKVHAVAATTANELTKLGYEQTNSAFFDTIVVKADAQKIKVVAEQNNINFFYIDEATVSIAFNETTEHRRRNQNC